MKPQPKPHAPARAADYPPLALSKRYYAIGEVSALCEVKAHVLRYWEQEFPQLKPLKRRGNRRYYQASDVETVHLIKGLLYQQGFTIQGARLRLKEVRTEAEPANQPQLPLPEQTPNRLTAAGVAVSQIAIIRIELEELLRRWPN
jgi:DNA-binding transcriptional MerR regulator